MLDYAAITDTRISYSTPVMSQPLIFVADSLVSSIDNGDLKVILTGSLNETPLYFEKKTGPIANLLEYRDVTVDLHGNIGEIEINGGLKKDAARECDLHAAAAQHDCCFAHSRASTCDTGTYPESWQV